MPWKRLKIWPLGLNFRESGTECPCEYGKNMSGSVVAVVFCGLKAYVNEFLNILGDFGEWNQLCFFCIIGEVWQQGEGGNQEGEGASG